MVKLLRACVWMPWHKQAMKDAVSCDKPREDANSLCAGDFEWKPIGVNTSYVHLNT